MGVRGPAGGSAGGTSGRVRGSGGGRRAPSEVRVSVLGGFSVTADGVPVALPKMARRVVALLALHPGGLSRSAAARELAPHLEPESARAGLRNALARLRETRLPLLAADGAALRLHAGVSVDAREAEALAARLVDLAQPLPDHVPHELLTRELLPGWDDVWAERSRTGMQGRFLHALEVYARRLASDGEPYHAQVVAQRVWDSDPLRETAVSVLIGIHLDGGNRGQALGFYHAFEQELGARLGLGPTEALGRLVAPLLGGRLQS